MKRLGLGRAGARVRTVAEQADRSVAIIDIGSNSVRFVVYQGPERLPAVLFNEKVTAGLGRSLSKNGRIDSAAMAVAQAGLARFAGLAREMGVANVRTVATAAVRDAENGDELIEAAEALGLSVELLTGDAEATAAGYGVISATPDADGIVGDLGGGSLELVRVVAGTITDRASFPLGVLRLAAIRERGPRALAQHLDKVLRDAGWIGRGKGLPLYMVGGSWRALARLDMHLTSYPLPVIHGYTLTPAAVKKLVQALDRMDRAELKAVTDLSSMRIPTLGDAVSLLDLLLARLGSDRAIASAYGLREGLLFQELAGERRRLDPLIESARDEARRLARFPEHGDLIAQWIAPLFAEDDPQLVRLRHVACLLVDVGWRAHPEFRVERGVETALHGAWVAIDPRGRALVAQALSSALGGAASPPEPLSRLAGAAELAQAGRWGLAIRLAQRLSGGVAAPLARSSVRIAGDTLALTINAADRALYGEAVEKRHKALAIAMALTPALA